MRTIQHALRQAADPRPGTEVLDAGCGIGLETARLAAAYPETLVSGLDRNAELWASSGERVSAAVATQGWAPLLKVA